MVKTKRYIEVPPAVAIAFIAILAVLFTIGVYRLRKQSEMDVILTFEMKLDTTFIQGYEGYGHSRGAVYYKKHHFILSSSPYIEDNCGGYTDWGHQPIISFTSTPPPHRLFDLKFPYTVYKKAYNDTIYAEKDGCTLKFLLEPPLPPEAYERDFTLENIIKLLKGEKKPSDFE